LRRGIGYLHDRDDFQGESLPTTSCKLVDRQARNPSPTATAQRGFWSDDDVDRTIEATRTDMESKRLDRSDSQRPSAQFLPTDAVISTEMRLTTRELYPERTAGPYSPDSHCQTGLLEGEAAILVAQVRGAYLIQLLSAPSCHTSHALLPVSTDLLVRTTITSTSTLLEIRTPAL